MKKLGIVFLLLCVVWACKPAWKSKAYEGPREVYRVMPYPQHKTGDPEKGLDYIMHGNAVGNGIPYPMYQRLFKETQDTVLNRTGDNGKVPYFNTVFTTVKGERVVSGNCFFCHAATNPATGKVHLGLGNSLGDFTKDDSKRFKLLAFMIKNKYGKASSMWQNYEEQHKWYQSVVPSIVMPKIGINPAFRIEEASLAFRNPDDLKFKAEPNYDIPPGGLGTDVPPLWNVKKKNALYYNASGRGDYTKLLMQVSVLGIHDSTAAREVQQNFKDVLAWLESLEPPEYPHPVNKTLAAKGQMLFLNTCKKCHGSYDGRGYYPNKLVPIKEIKTDSIYAQYAMESHITKWYNESWFGQTPDPAKLQPSFGYIAPPLDGVWATAPYLHNGSVPDLESLLNSKSRPTFWKRSMEADDYNFDKVGWNYEVVSNGNGKKTYDTTLPGYGNYGHYFGDEFTADERRAVIEYLKTL